MIDAAKAKLIHDEINAAIRAVANKHGLNVMLGGLRYSADSCKFSGATFADKTLAPSDTDPRWLINLKRFGHWFDFSTKDIGTKFQFNNEAVEFVGLKDKNWVVARKVVKSGKHGFYKIRIAEAQRLLNKRQSAQIDFGA